MAPQAPSRQQGGPLSSATDWWFVCPAGDGVQLAQEADRRPIGLERSRTGIPSPLSAPPTRLSSLAERQEPLVKACKFVARDTSREKNPSTRLQISHLQIPRRYMRQRLA